MESIELNQEEVVKKLERHIFNLRIETVALKKAFSDRACERRKALEHAKKEIARLLGDAY